MRYISQMDFLCAGEERANQSRGNMKCEVCGARWGLGDYQWISVKQRKPTKEECQLDAGWFLVSRDMEGYRADLSRYDGYQEWKAHDHGWKYSFDDNITHWMPLPRPVKRNHD